MTQSKHEPPQLNSCLIFLAFVSLIGSPLAHDKCMAGDDLFEPSYISEPAAMPTFVPYRVRSVGLFSIPFSQDEVHRSGSPYGEARNTTPLTVDDPSRPLFGDETATQPFTLADESSLANYLTIAVNLDGGYRDTNFYAKNWNTTLLQYDARGELWLPPFRNSFSWGPYLRGAGTISDKADAAFENGVIAAPGFGLQVYPFSLEPFRNPASVIGHIFGPTRLFAEYDIQNYYGATNEWRPTRNVRAGAEYYRAIGVNDTSVWHWEEFYTALYFVDANEFTSHYDSFQFPLVFRAGVRKPDSGLLSWISPYFAVDSSLTGHPSYTFENRILLGGGIRFTPPLPRGFLMNRCFLFVEYDTGIYYHTRPPASTSLPGSPSWDIRAGIGISLGDFWK